MVMNKQLATVILVAAAVAGCGTSSSSGSLQSVGSSSVSPSPTRSVSPSAPVTPAPFSHPQVLRTTAPSPPPTRIRVSLPWQLLRVGDGGRQVQVAVDYGGCTTFDYAQVVQRSDSVEITTWGLAPRSMRAICPMFEAVLRGTITLAAPLGSRQLVHGAVARHVSLPPM